MTSALLHDFFSSNNQVRSTRRTWPGMTVLEKQSNILPFHQETQETAQETENRKALVIRAYNEDISSSDDDIVSSNWGAKNNRLALSQALS
jgi:hypothetical protein